MQWLASPEPIDPVWYTIESSIVIVLVRSVALYSLPLSMPWSQSWM